MKRSNQLVVIVVTLVCAFLLGGCSKEQSPPGQLTSVISFSFDVQELRTDHQFDGQLNSFHVEYQYSAVLSGGGLDPQGHPVDDDTYPYFQDIRDDMIAYVRAYPDKQNFYEVFGDDIANHLMTAYPQLAWITIKIDVPAHGGVKFARSGLIRVDRQD